MKYQINIPHGKNHSKTASKTTASLYLNKNLVEKARKHQVVAALRGGDAGTRARKESSTMPDA